MQFSKILLSALLLLFSHYIQPQEVGHIEWKKCLSSDCSDIDQVRVRFGTIKVPEHYQQEQPARLLDIAFAIIKARQQPAPSDAVLIFAGGWGSSILRHIHYFSDHFLGEDRDIILYDYRGLGYSSPSLCPSIGEEVFQLLLENKSHEAYKVWQVQRFDECLDELAAQGIDFTQYGTDNRSRDANLLAERLPYESYNLFGTSGGTRTIQSFMRNATVPIRSAIFDSTVPIGHPIILDGFHNYQQSLDRIFKHCLDDPACRKAYPNLKSRFLAFLKTLNEQPLALKLRGLPKAYLNKQEVNALVYNQLYEENNFGFLPFFLEALIGRKSAMLRRLINRHEMRNTVLEAFNAPGFLNYMNDYKVFQNDSLIQAQRPATLANYEVLDGYLPYFIQDKRFHKYPDEAQPISSDIPSLFLVGSYDPTTPPAYTEFLLSNFTQAHFVQLPKVGHGVFNQDCGQALMLNFIQKPTKRPNTYCVDQLKNWQISFFVRGQN
ncbi:MAG: alpha/beta hydrolase [Saprospiraceae bacterium]|nr:alpha/beta hydrolase [Saprospiraceae bacterium]